MPPRRASRAPQPAATPAERPTPAPARPSLAALLQRAAAAPATLNPQSVAALHQSIGNRAVMQLMQQGVIQKVRGRKRSKRAARSKKRSAAVVLREGRITSVSFKGNHRPATGKGKQGDHVSAYVTTTAMVKNAVHGALVAELSANLSPVIQHILGLSGMSNRRWGPFLRQRIQREVEAPALEISTNGGSASAIGALLYDLTAIVNQIPGSTIIHATSTGGHNEGYINARLQDAETRLRNGNDVPYAKHDLADDAWGMFDYHPTTSTEDSVIIRRLAEHIKGVAIAYPKTILHIGGKQYLHERLESTHAANIFNRMSEQRERVRDILDKVDEAI